MGFLCLHLSSAVVRFAVSRRQRCLCVWMEQKDTCIRTYTIEAHAYNSVDLNWSNRIVPTISISMAIF